MRMTVQFVYVDSYNPLTYCCMTSCGSVSESAVTSCGLNNSSDSPKWRGWEVLSPPPNSKRFSGQFGLPAYGCQFFTQEHTEGVYDWPLYLPSSAESNDRARLTCTRSQHGIYSSRVTGVAGVQRCVRWLLS